jgi:DnaA family protein
MAMKQLALDIGLATGPTLSSFFAGPNEDIVRHLQLWAGNPTRSPVPTYLWGTGGSGKTHLLRGVRETLRELGASGLDHVGWLDSSMHEPPEYSEEWVAVLLDEVHLYTAVQQHAAFNWFVNAQTHQRWVLAAGEFPPTGLRLREDLRTRLGWGHVFHLAVLSEPERRAVLRKEADARGIFLGDDVMDFMLTRFSRDLGSLMQLLDQLDGYALQAKRGITIPLLKSMLEQS